MGAFTYKELSVLYEDNHLLVVEKPVNIPMQKDSSMDVDLLTLCKEYLKVTYQKPGNVYCGLVQRLDRPVGGVCVFAKTSKAASRLSSQMQKNTFEKEYQAIVCGKTKAEDTLIDYLYKDTKNNRVSVVNQNNKQAKKAILSYTRLSYQEDYSLVKISLETGRSHQIRVQFSSRNFPLWGDQRYNKNAVVGQQIALWATKLTFEHPTTKETMSFVSQTPKTGIWQLFEETL